MSSNVSQERPSFSETWEVIVAALRQRIDLAKRQYGLEPQSLQLIEQPQRTVVISVNGKPLVQASISLSGDKIKIIEQRDTGFGRVNEEDVVEVEQRNRSTVYVHSGEQFVDANNVSEIILSPILDRYRMAS